MFELFHLSAPWWMFVLRAAAIYALVMVLVRVSGKRAVGQITPFDLVLLILIGNAVQNGINGGDDSLTGAAIMATTLIALNYGVAYVTSRSRRAETFTEIFGIRMPFVAHRLQSISAFSSMTLSSVAMTFRSSATLRKRSGVRMPSWGWRQRIRASAPASSSVRAQICGW